MKMAIFTEEPPELGKHTQSFLRVMMLVVLNRLNELRKGEGEKRDFGRGFSTGRSEVSSNFPKLRSVSLP